MSKANAVDLKVLHMGVLYLYILNKDSNHYALSRDIAQGALVFHGTSACTGRPFDG